MHFVTKHFGCFAGQEWLHNDPLMYGAAIGFVHATSAPCIAYGRFRYVLVLTFRLLPIFIWQQELLGNEHGRRVYQNRIVGISDWPFRLRFYHNLKEDDKCERP